MVDSSRIADQAQQHPDALRTLEHRAIAAATRPLAQSLTNAQAEAVTRWIRETARSALPAALDDFIAHIRELLAQAFNGKAAQAQRATETAAFNAAQLGSRQALAIATAMGQRPPAPVNIDAGADAQQAAAAIPAAVEQEHTHALTLLTTASLTALGLAGLAAVFTRARRAVGRIAAGMAVAITGAAAHGSSLIARTLGPGVRLLWVAEPGACDACRAYAGMHIKPGGRFRHRPGTPPGRYPFVMAISGPPRHPNCRCTLIPWSPSWQMTGRPLPTLLRLRARTARRP